MTQNENTAPPLVSVIIPCYNHAHFLAEAIESVLAQSYPAIEILVVDDGSTDHTREVAARYPRVRYLHQHNQGLSASRNTGIRHSRGRYLVFLDADDLLYPWALERNVALLEQHPEAAFVSGAHDKVYVGRSAEDHIKNVDSDHYSVLLQGNYIGMIATVLFQRWVLEEFQFDTSLKTCEDYDIFLKIARKYPVVHHTYKLATYRFHTSNMSGNIPQMLSDALKVLERQKSLLQSEQEEQAYAIGFKFWISYFLTILYEGLVSKKIAPTQKNIATLLEYNPKMGQEYVAHHKLYILKSRVKEKAGNYLRNCFTKSGAKSTQTLVEDKNEVPLRGRLTPLSTDFGYDRGGPIDRYYIENFLQQEADRIQGHVLEIGDNAYTLQYGGERVQKSDILHVDESNPVATIVGDLSNAPHVPDNQFDCIILTQTLHLIYDFKGALQTCYRILKPGGTLLLTTPGITPLAHGGWKETWYWAFTDKALSRLMAETFPEEETSIKTYGNVFVASAFLYGLGLPEVPKAKIDYHDPHFQVIVTVKAVKKPTS